MHLKMPQVRAQYSDKPLAWTRTGVKLFPIRMSSLLSSYLNKKLINMAYLKKIRT